MSSSGAPRRVRGDWVRRHPVIVVVLLVMWVAVWLSLAGFGNAQWTRLDQHRFPWAYAESKRPTLTGVWAGTLTTNLGTRRGLLLELQLVPLNFPHAGRRTEGFNLRFFRRAASDNLTGTLHVCGGPAGDQNFTLRGNIAADDASRFRLGVSAADSAPADGLAPGELRGTWNKRDSLAVVADLYVSYRGERVSNPRDSETARPQPGVLHRADRAEFRTVCDRLWAGQ